MTLQRHREAYITRLTSQKKETVVTPMAAFEPA